MHPQNRCNKNKAASTIARSNRSTLIGSCLLLCILFAGVITVDVSNPAKKEPFDPRVENSKDRVLNAMDPHYQGYVPQDAVIPTQDGIFVVDQWGRFMKVSGDVKVPATK